MRTVSLWTMRATGLNLGNPWVTEGEAGVKKMCLPSPCSLRRQRRKGRRMVVVGIVCFTGKEYSMGAILPIVNLWRISWLAFKTWPSIWAAPAWQGRQQECEHGFGLLKEHSCLTDAGTWFDSSSSQPGNGLKAGAPFLVRLLGIEEGSVTPQHKILMSLSSAGTELDPVGSRRKDLFLDLWRAELDSPKAGENLKGKLLPIGKEWDSLSTVVCW